MKSLGGYFRNKDIQRKQKPCNIEVLDKRNKILGVQHPDTIDAMESLAATYSIIAQKNMQRQRSWECKFWMQATKFLEWNTQRQSEPWQI